MNYGLYVSLHSNVRYLNGQQTRRRRVRNLCRYWEINEIFSLGLSYSKTYFVIENSVRKTGVELIIIDALSVSLSE